ncbi:mammalian cell entry protein [Betaproteobacteria bacterium SCGC AG-212-J23]|nr:mammalian cell entry protein [Betaproteobacteria bacterium SCGC AG-212-J23]
MAEPQFTPIPRNLQFRVGLLIGLTVVIAVGFVFFVLYARGTFDQTQRLVLVADNAEGVAIGMDLTFSGFPIGRVRRITLRDDGKARILVRVPVEDARWLRTSTIFTLERGIVGAPKIRAFSANLKDPLLPNGAERPVLRGDATEEIPRMVASLRALLENLQNITGPGGSVQASLDNVRTLTERMAGKQGALDALLGEEDAKQATQALDRVNKLLTSLGGVSQRLDATIAKADARVLGQGGLVDGAQQAVGQMNAALGEVRDNLKRVEKILADAEAVSGNAKAATADLGALRAEVDASLRKVSSLIEEINRKWPFERNSEIRLP